MNRRSIMGLYKRMFIVFIFLIPVYIILDNLLGQNASNFTKISIYVLFGAAVISVVELIRYKKMQK
ncbi:MAG: hypothetical protein PHC46_00410 [Clostridia bacterium]|nr:hypothetical protein [Clostridia bacterium]